MQKRFLFFLSFLISAAYAFADYSDHGKPWDANDNYDSSHGLWFAVFILAVIIIVAIGAAGKHAWDNHKSSIKDGLGVVAFFGGCILLFIAGKACSEQHPKDNGNATNVQQYHQQYQQQNPVQQQHKQQPHTEYYYEECTACYGKGYVRCPYCNGSGSISNRCNYCNGSGLVKHELLPGYIVDDRCEHCNGRGNNLSSCTHCGPRYIPEFQSTVVGYANCAKCNGTGKVQRSRTAYY